MDYQARVSAWASVHLLAEDDVEPPFRLSAPVVRITCESRQPVDDLILGTDAGCAAYVQVKRSATLARDGQGNLASTMDQFVRQYVAVRSATANGEDTSEPGRDRLVLVVGAGAPATIRVTLRETLERVRTDPGDELPGAELGAERGRALDVIAQHIRASWRAAVGSNPSHHDVRELLNLVYVETIELGEGERDERSAKTILRRSVLETPEHAAKAWSILIQEGLRLIRTRGHADRDRLLDVLNAAGLGVRAPKSYREGSSPFLVGSRSCA